MQATVATAAPYRIHRYPTHLIQRWSLPSGVQVTLRPVLPQDSEAEQAFVAGLSIAARGNRFHGGVSGLSSADAERFACVDYRQRMGFVVTVMDGDDERVIADACYAMTHDGDSAEFALVVADEWQGFGLGRRLVDALGQRARHAGARWLCGEVRATNLGMLALMRRSGFCVGEHRSDDALVTVEKNLAMPETTACRSANESLFGGLGQALAHWIAPLSSSGRSGSSSAARWL